MNRSDRQPRFARLATRLVGARFARALLVLGASVCAIAAGATELPEDPLEAVHWRPVELAQPVHRDACRLAVRTIDIRCDESDWCTVIDTLAPRPGFPCTGDWRVETVRGDDVTPPTLAMEIGPWSRDGVTAVSGRCEGPDRGVGWCFRDVPEASRLRFTMRVRAHGHGQAEAAVLAMHNRHPLVSAQDREIVPYKGIVLGLTPEVWKDPIAAAVTFEARGVSRSELSSRSLYAVPSSDHPPPPKTTPWDVRASVGAQPSRKLQLDAEAGVRYVDAGFVRPTNTGLSGITTTLLAGREQGQWTAVGRLAFEVWAGRFGGGGVFVEGTGTRRLAAGVEAMALTTMGRAVSGFGLPAVGLGVALVGDVTPHAQAWARVEALVQHRWFGVTAGWDQPLGGDQSARLAFGLSIGL